MALIPIESNPEVMTQLISKLGVPSQWGFVDVFGLEEEQLSWVPRPALALILLFPVSTDDRVITESKDQALPPDVFFMKQSVPNACGTIAIIHSILNNLDQIELEDGSLKTYWEKAKDLSPEARGKLLEDTTNNKIIEAHEELSHSGQTQAPPDNQPVIHHFLAYVEKNGQLYELDGRQSIPINHGPTTKDTVLKDAAKIVRDFISKDKDSHNFSTIALVKVPQNN